ncbi:MAG: hypothetical protein ABIT20_16300, partial [Gemmatimonadaceae bacterium]
MPLDNQLPDAAVDLAHGVTSRRAFLRTASFTAAGAAALAACGKNATATPVKGAGAAASASVAPAAAPVATAATIRAAADAMDAMHEKGIKAFPAKTKGLGNQLMEPRI